MDIQIDLTTVAKRRALPAQKNPHFVQLAGSRGGLSLGWRQPGRWVAKLVDGKRIEKVIGISEEVFGGMSYSSAVVEAHAWAKREQLTDPTVGPLTVGTAVEGYMVAKCTENAKLGRKMTFRVKRHVVSDTRFCGIQLNALTALDIEAWRGRLAKNLKPATVNRLLSDVRAALNLAADRYNSMLPGGLRGEIKIGTRNMHIATIDKARNVPILSLDEVKRLIAAAFDINEDFGRLVMVLAATGSRHSQIAKLQVRDLTVAGPGGVDTLLVPGDLKGRAKQPKASQKIAIAPEVRARLAPVVVGRAQNEPLLMRSVYRDGEERRVAWGEASEYDKVWTKALKAAGLPWDTVPYALRHSSIVRALHAGLRASEVAKMHFTSALMIENHYGLHVRQDIDLRAALRL